MGKYKNGLLGEFHGGVGSVVGATWKGISYMRSRQRTTNKPRSKAQLAQQAKFSLLQNFLLSIRAVVMLGFNSSAIKMTGINSAYSYNYKHSITGEYPAFELNYSKVLVSAGQLIGANDGLVTAEDDGKLKFTWTDNSDMAMANENDRCMVVVYCPEKKTSAYQTAGAMRSEGMHRINVGVYSGNAVETWLAFVSADGADVSTSIYLGRVMVL